MSKKTKPPKRTVSENIPPPKPQKSVSLPKIKSPKENNANSSTNPISRILNSVSAIMDDSVSSMHSLSSSSQDLMADNSRSSITSEMMEMLLDEGLDSQNEFIPRFQSLHFSNEHRRRIIRNCLDLKRLMDKESIPLPGESTLQKILFSKSHNINVSIFFRCLQEYLDVDTTIVITNLLNRLVTNAECATSNASYLAKKNLCPLLLQNMQAIYSEHFPSDPSTPPPATLVSRAEEAFQNIFSLLLKIAKYGRLHGSVSITFKITKRCFEKRDYTFMMLGLGLLKIFAAKNDNNVISLQKTSVLHLIDNAIRSNIPQNILKMDVMLDLLAIISKSKTVAQDILKTFGMKFILSQCSCMVDTTQKAALRLLKSLNEYEFGKKVFESCDGSRILSETLITILQATDGPSNSLTTANSVASLLVAALRSAAGHSDLPFIESFQYRKFPLPQEKHTEDGETNEYDLDYNTLVDECADDLLKGEYPIIPNPPESVEDLVRLKMRRLCPELVYLDGKPLPKCDMPGSNISVRHVQPMAPGKHFVARSNIEATPEPLLKRSPAAFRKVLFEQTSKMFHLAQKGSLVYDVMNPGVAQEATGGDCLMFDSRFESGNLQLAIKISPFEYDLLVETDINSVPGKHNQWFYFSVKNMVPNTTYRFNLLNMSKPASQFNNGMQPVIYSQQDPGWRRIGDAVYYIKNHYKKEFSDSAEEIHTYATLTFTLQFKNENDLCFIAYHYTFTYSELQRSLYQLQSSPNFKLNCRKTLLCRTLGGNDCILLTITDFTDSKDALPLNDRKYIFLTARVHPGESNSSHTMQGLIQFLLSDDPISVSLRQKCIFKIVPMLNPDGVINGSHRCSLAGTDLNRQWKTPSRLLSPTIFWTKLMYRMITKVGHPPLLVCDFHGHSRKKNAFLFGCENIGTEFDGAEKLFATLLAQQSNLLDLNSCKYTIEKSKEATSRVVLRREFGIINSFTLESTYCGMDFGEKKIQVADLVGLGESFARAIHALVETTDSLSLTKLYNDSPRYSITSNADTTPSGTPKSRRKVKTGKRTIVAKPVKKKSEKKSPILSRHASEKDIDAADDLPSEDTSSDDDDDGE